MPTPENSRASKKKTSANAFTMSTRTSLLLACLMTAASAKKQLTTLKFVGARKTVALDNSTHYEGGFLVCGFWFVRLFVFFGFFFTDKPNNRRHHHESPSPSSPLTSPPPPPTHTHTHALPGQPNKYGNMRTDPKPNGCRADEEAIQIQGELNMFVFIYFPSFFCFPFVSVKVAFFCLFVNTATLTFPLSFNHIF
jgi:hypothetical protein